ncbi:MULTISPECIES: protocatechuate 3,4-dioxygenase subunit alpha [unclassified Chelatococcus]|uniref:protocatechuate 3,4-dioxygenase subunit alpha n=1 Tax=unclassified Chelatococcus TaxID=2638111 RepID=UPI001BCFCBD6|nr:MULTISPECIES: protocatechuate 3,4-dioxygenase subunit alpha [unclassified Chelatococcus]MBS7699791.1 protocatechuate 3,4-dioxygenase subunit alpha [Chelatococcus sp. YT9]MBX3558137.1 protocatechuate 3,4-dioxygenase subunit alpha [Chelatococcus sp.]
MLHPVPTLKETPSQTAGPYVHIGLTPNFAEIRGIYDADPGATMVSPDTRGERIVVSGRIIDGAGAAVSDAVVEIWQADTDGSYTGQVGRTSNSRPTFTGWGRQATNSEGVFLFETIKPGPVRGPDGTLMAPHIALWIVARGINIGLQTRLYFADEEAANGTDFVLSRIPDPKRRATLIARKEEGDVPRYVLDIHLQGDRETVFFDM